MFQWLYKFLIVTVTLSFFISATELDLGKGHNSFFDDYDTYIKTEHVSFNLVAVERPAFDSDLFIQNLSSWSAALVQKKQTPNYHSPVDRNDDPPDLCILNSTWRI